jgi:hypothetical protein
MSHDTVTIALGGENIRLDDFADAIRHFAGLIRAMGEEVASGVQIVWTIDELERGSALATVRGTPASPDEMPSVENVVRAYARLGQALENNEPIPYSPQVQSHVIDLTEILRRKHVENLRFETAEEESVITQPAGPVPATPALVIPGPAVAHGAVEGVVQTLSNRGSLRFTLFDIINDRAVSCYLEEGNEAVMRNAWGKRAVIEGQVRRDPTSDRPITIRKVSKVTVLSEDAPDAYRRARGVTPAESGLSAEDAIRRLRDA